MFYNATHEIACLGILIANEYKILQNLVNGTLVYGLLGSVSVYLSKKNMPQVSFVWNVCLEFVFKSKVCASIAWILINYRLKKHPLLIFFFKRKDFVKTKKLTRISQKNIFPDLKNVDLVIFSSYAQNICCNNFFCVEFVNFWLLTHYMCLKEKANYLLFQKKKKIWLLRILYYQEILVDRLRWVKEHSLSN